MGKNFEFMPQSALQGLHFFLAKLANFLCSKYISLQKQPLLFPVADVLQLLSKVMAYGDTTLKDIKIKVCAPDLCTSFVPRPIPSFSMFHAEKLGMGLETRLFVYRSVQNYTCTSCFLISKS